MDPLNASTINYNISITCFTNLNVLINGTYSFDQSCEEHNGKFEGPTRVQWCIFIGVVQVMKQKCVWILVLLVCVCANPPDRPWRGRTRDWDTTQRRRGVLQAERGTRQEDFPSFMWEEGFLIRSSGHQMVLQRHAWSMFRDEDEGRRKAEGHSHQGHHHNSRAKWLMATINVAPEKRGYYKCCGRDLCFSLYQLELQEEQSSLLINGKNGPTRQDCSRLSVQNPNKIIGWMKK